ncbi:acyl-CoA dehydrogenase family protein [Nocardia carnea]|uniref:acyl-CoA dehydrogenase family protein n=1 Tax=Nocardia carnea TaxID=37328 RepID=UPI0024553A97|nr:acyl-CoA dehydrogenase family protein [Nocardia carnea]
MTSLDTATARGGGSTPSSGYVAEPIASLRRVIFGSPRSFARHMRVRDALTGLSDVPQSGLAQIEEALYSYTLLPRAIDALGGSAAAIEADARESDALFDWAAAVAPRLWSLLSGHHKLSVAAIQQLGDGSVYQQKCLAQLDNGAVAGVAMFTELGYGSDIFHVETTATWQRHSRTFRLDSPTPQSVKFMPNTAAEGVARTVIVVARLIVEGRDEGVWPFVMELRTRDGLADGVEMAALPDTGYGLWMDHAMTRFDAVILPESALLCGEVAAFDSQGGFHCELSLGERFARTTSPLHPARLSMGGAAVSAARAGLALTIPYAGIREIGPGKTMISRDHIARKLVYAMSEAFAMTCLSNTARTHGRSGDAGEAALWGMLAKAMASHSAWKILEVCREVCAAQGMLRANYLVDHIAACQGLRTAEGANAAVLAAAGRALRHRGRLLPGSSDSGGAQTWWQSLLTERERLLTIGIDVAGQPDNAAMELAAAVGDRIAVDAMVAATESVQDPVAHQLLTDLAATFALRKVKKHALWFTANECISSSYAAVIDSELLTHQRGIEPHLRLLAQSFALPDSLPAPMARDYVRWWIDFAGWSDRFGTPPAATA